MSGMLRRAARRLAVQQSRSGPSNTVLGSSSVLQNRRPTHAAVWSQSRYNGGGFIKEIMNQVNAELDKNKDFKEAKKKLDDTGFSDNAAKLAEEAKKQEEKLRETATGAADKGTSFFKQMREQAGDKFGKVQAESTENDNIKKIREAMSPVTAKLSEYSAVAKEKVGKVGGKGLDYLQANLKHLQDEKKTKGLEEWRKKKVEMDKARAEARAKAEEAGEEFDDVAQAKYDEEVAKAAVEGNPEAGNAIVVKEESSWDRMGAALKDMPFLHSFYENPAFDRVFGETEIAQSIREMKDEDPKFRIAEFGDEVEHIIAPSVIQAYLDGEDEWLKLHCGEAAFAAVNASIKERKKMKVVLDRDMLQPPREVELKGAKPVDGDMPYAHNSF